MEPLWIKCRDFFTLKDMLHLPDVYFGASTRTADSTGNLSHGKIALVRNQGSGFPCSSSYVIFSGISKSSKLLKHAGFLSYNST